jgi:hypothetical protein
MNVPHRASLAAIAALAASLGCESPPPLAPGGVTAGWPVYGGEAGGSRYSPLDQINRENVRFLEEAWRIRTGDLDVDPPPPGHMGAEHKRFKRAFCAITGSMSIAGGAGEPGESSGWGKKRSAALRGGAALTTGARGSTARRGGATRLRGRGRAIQV